MHGLINKGLQGFICNIYGRDHWSSICFDIDWGSKNFETMVYYDDFVTEQIIEGACIALGRDRNSLLEDFGTFLISEHSSSSVRNLLRMGGENFVDFLHSLENVQENVNHALPDLDIPLMHLEVQSSNEFVVKSEFDKFEYGSVLMGLLRAMADDYGSLIMIEMRNRKLEGLDLNDFHIKVFDDSLKSAA